MTVFPVVLLAAISFLVGAVFAWLLFRSQAAALQERKNSLEQELATARAASDRQVEEIRALSEARAALHARLDSERHATEEKVKLLQDASEHLKIEFKSLAATALETNNATFLDLAHSTLDKYQTQAKGDLEAREHAVETLIKPITESLKHVDDEVRNLEKARAEAYGTLTTQVASLLDTQKALQIETGNLVKALREPQARGRWGELQLRKVLELAGMLEHCDFLEQETATSDEGRLRPDVIVKLPGEKNIVIDSKASLAAFDQASQSDDDQARRERLIAHARQVKQHVDNLSAKSYWAQFQPTPEFVILFLPGEVFFRAALEGDFELIEYGISRRVIIASPMTLIALLKAVAHGWNEKNLAENARRISDAGKDLYKRLCTMTSYVEELGKKLGGAVKAYDEMLRSMERRVFPLARKFPEIDRSLPAQSLPELDPLDKAPFELQAPDWQEPVEHAELPFGEETADGAKA